MKPDATEIVLRDAILQCADRLAVIEQALLNEMEARMKADEEVRQIVKSLTDITLRILERSKDK